MMNRRTAVKYIKGGIAIDDRGQISFCNDFVMTGIKRFYLVSNHRSEFIRAWHGHKEESKYVFIPSGTCLFATVKIFDWDSPNKNEKVERYVLSDKDPGILYVPPGYAHGYKTLTSDTKVFFFSTSTLKDSVHDDFRFDPYYWNPWDIAER